MLSDNLDKLTSLQYEVTQNCATEPAFNNLYWNNKEAGIYFDITSSIPLFLSTDKYDSGSGWPSFTKPIDKDHIIEKEDMSKGYNRVEVKAKNSNSHLGHVFTDGPKEKGGLRYCINSASLSFIPYNKLQENNYEHYKFLLELNLESILISGGCFWGMEELFRKRVGVVKTKVGYSGGAFEKPSYEDVKKGITKHAETLLVTFDNSKTNLEEILNYFFKIHNPTTINRQGNDSGSQYRSAIFYITETQKNIAKDIINKIDNLKVWPSKIVTTVEQAKKFYDAEEYHQKYLEKNPNGYTCHFEREF